MGAGTSGSLSRRHRDPRVRSMSEHPDLYAVLGIAPGTHEESIRAAYRSLARIHHPDVGGSADRITLLNESWAVLSQPRKRRAYDRQLGLSHVSDVMTAISNRPTPLPSAPKSAGPIERRSQPSAGAAG